MLDTSSVFIMAGDFRQLLKFVPMVRVELTGPPKIELDSRLRTVVQWPTFKRQGLTMVNTSLNVIVAEACRES